MRPTLPILMPPVDIDGDIYVDGALGFLLNGGLPFRSAAARGYRKLLVVLTRPRDYVMGPMSASVGASTNRRNAVPSVAEGGPSSRLGNAGRRSLRASRNSQAYVFAPDNLWITESQRTPGRPIVPAWCRPCAKCLGDQGVPGVVGFFCPCSGGAVRGAAGVLGAEGLAARESSDFCSAPRLEARPYLRSLRRLHTPAAPVSLMRG